MAKRSKFDLAYAVYLLALCCSLYVASHIPELDKMWDSKIQRQSVVVTEAEVYGQKLHALEGTIMQSWDKSFQELGNSDRVTLSRLLNIQGTALIPFSDVPQINSNERVVHQIGGQSVLLGLRKVCFGQGASGYSAKSHSFVNTIAAMKNLERQAAVDFDRFTISFDNQGLIINFYDLCLSMKEA